jgi:glycosyltransferase involved in cell wall biosynthesis
VTVGKSKDRQDHASLRRNDPDNCADRPLSQPEPPLVGYSIIICTHNRAELLGKCLRAAIREAASVDAPGEIVVVDNASRDRTRAVFDACVDRAGDVRLVYLFEGKPNLCIARNRGLDAALGDIVIFLDDDAIAAEGWLSSCLAAFAAFPDAAVAGGEILPLLEGSPPDWFRAPLTHIYTVISLGGTAVRPFPNGGHPLGANMAFRKHVFLNRRFSERLGRSEANLMTGDEAEICASIRHEGGKILYVPGMKVEHFIHPDRLTEEWALRRYYFEGVSRARMQLDRKAQLIMVCAMGTKLLFFLATRPLLISHFRKLLWDCRIRKSLGYFSQLAGLAHHSTEAA